MVSVVVKFTQPKSQSNSEDNIVLTLALSYKVSEQ